MKKISLLIILAITCATQYSCTKDSFTTATKQSPPTQSTSRTVDGITFVGDIAWFKFGVRDNINGNWQCTEETGFCEYNYIASAAGHIPVDGEATGEMGYDSYGRFIIALDNSSLTSSEKFYASRDGEFHFDSRDGTLRVNNSFTIKNTADPDQTTDGDITIAAGDYPVFEDANSTLILFEAD